MVWLLYLLLLLPLTVILLTFLFLLSSIIAFFFTRVPFASTPQRNVNLIIEKLNLKPGEIFYDLGCGDARFLLAAERYGVRATGFEVSPWAFFKARINRWHHRSQSQLHYKNFYSINIGDADVIVCFLLDTVMAKVERKLLAELKPGARVVSYGFKLPTWQPIEVIDLLPNSKRTSRIYFYQKA